MVEHRFVIASLLTLLVGLVGCDTTATSPASQVVVEAYLQGGAALESVRVSRSVDTDETYVLEDVALRDADVAVQRLADDGAVTETHGLREHPNKPGVYVPGSVPPPTIQPQTTYRLVVNTSDGTEVTATTSVPAPVDIVDVENDRVVYQGPVQPSLTVAPPASERNRQNVLVLTTTSLLDFNRPDEELRIHLTPLYGSGYDPDDDNIRSLRVTSSGLLNEANFDRDEEGHITIDLPWLSVAFYGRNEVAVNAIDSNLYDLIRTQQAQQGGGLAPGELPNVIEHVEGGTGIFGSYVRADHEVTIQRPSDDGE